MEGCILQSLALEGLGRRRQSLSALGDALEIRGQRGYVRLFVDEGTPLARLLYHAASNDIFPDAAGELLAAFDTAGPQSDTPDLIEPLTPRETEILTLIKDGLTNQEIAARLVISLRTVKWHTSNIYGKLGVSNRTRAVALARDLGLLA